MRTLPILLLALVLSPLLHADRDARDRRGEAPRVVLYSGDNFEGVSVELLPGADVADLGDLSFSDGRKVRDRISSVRIFGGLKVVLYSDSSFSGDEIELADSVARLGRVPRAGDRGSWDNCVSSVRVSGGRPGWHEGEDRARVDGRRREPDLGRDRPSRHAGPSGADVERLISRAYRELLDREPTGAEIRRQREAVFSQGWGRDEIYDEIRASREFRAKEADRIIDRVYREMLGREPDTVGRAGWIRRLVDKGWSERRFIEEIRNCEEYRLRQGRLAQEKGRH